MTEQKMMVTAADAAKQMGLDKDVQVFIEAAQEAAEPWDQMRALLKYPGFQQLVKPGINRAWGGLDKFEAVMTQVAVSNPDILMCRRDSIYMALMECARLGLAPTGQRDGGWLIPRKGSAVFQISFQGVLQVVRRAIKTQDVVADVVRERDEFRVDVPNKVVEHTYDLRAEEKDRGAIVAAWAKITTEAGGVYLGLLNRTELAKIKRLGQGPAWKLWESEMFKRSAVVRAAKYAPQRSNDLSELDAAMGREYRADSGEVVLDV